MHVPTLIEKKREGQELTQEEIEFLIEGFTTGAIADYQMSAWAMAVFFKGMTPVETQHLTTAMMESGSVLEYPEGSPPKVDKHSTGGIGDKTSLVLAPLLACDENWVPMISGRGLGITGGTLDKLDSIPGFKTSIPAPRILEIVQTVGCIICGQTERMAPADKALYALVLDVKVGAAAFMPTLEQARKLARTMVDLGNECGVTTRALLSRMDAP